ncbi:Pisatin demethylase [Madurella fahalii]|uniref:Pisatin demethylase n=1 Tax=Madurella fahalii TaxID=1157608 RepID=A0ABQ0GJD4_9PEZI
MAILDEVKDQRGPILVGVAAIYFVLKIVQYYKLRYFRGPWAAAVSEIPQGIKAYTGQAHAWYKEVSDQYGPIARIGPNSLITSDPDVWIHINTKPGYKRSEWYFKSVRIEYRRDHIFSQTDTKLHDERKKQIIPGYSGRENLELEPSVDDRVQDLIDLIRSKYLSTDDRSVAMDLSKKIQYLTMDIISTVGQGKNFGMLRADTDIDGYIKSSEEGLRIGNAFMACGLTWLTQAPVVGQLLSPRTTDKTGYGAMIGACYRAIEERLNDRNDKRRDMLASFVRHGLAGDELRTEIVVQLVAGSDTTAGALRAIMLYIMATPHVVAKLRKEIDVAVRSGKVPESGAGIISLATAKQLPYLQAVIREGLRVYPPVRNLLPKDIPPGGDTVMVDGKPVFLPGGADIGVSVLAMHRNKRLFGDDADLFRPERWFEADPNRLAAMLKVNDLTFGHSRWACPGKTIAQMELNKVIFEAFRYFDWAIANPASPWDAFNVFGIFVINDQWVQVTARRDV